MHHFGVEAYVLQVRGLFLGEGVFQRKHSFACSTDATRNTHIQKKKTDKNIT